MCFVRCIYKFKIQVNWVNEVNYSELEKSIKNEITKYQSKKVANQKIAYVPTRLWDFLLDKLNIG